MIDYYFPLAPTGEDEFYDQIDVDDRFIFGWKDWEYTEEAGTCWYEYWRGGEIPDCIPTSSAYRERYRSLRREADDLYGKADHYAWLMVIGRVVSMVDAMILAKLHNRQIALSEERVGIRFDLFPGTGKSLEVVLTVRF